MGDTIKISCPVCGSVLCVKDSPDNEYRELTCPVCKKKSPFVSFRKIETSAADHTEYPDEGTRKTGNDDVIGRIVVPGKPLSFQLKRGLNLIGRKAVASNADIQLPCTSRRMSREHIVIEVKRVAGRGCVHYVSLNKEQVNPTYIGNQLLSYGDKIVLNHNDIILLPDMELRFELPDDDGTEIG